jgi:hypothetical protein
MINGTFLIAVADVLFGVGLMNITDKLVLKGIGNIVALVGIIYLAWYILNEGKAILANL